VFELACVVVVVLTLITMARRTPVRELLPCYALLAIASFVGEETCILFYRFYVYAPGWHLRIDEVPLLVPLIWPLVILSARQVAAALSPRTDAPIRRALWVFGLVVVDASLVEVVAVRAGLWSWAESGHLHVPVLGILGWGYFAGAAELVLGRFDGLRRAAVVVLAPLATHALLLASWWAMFRWTLRGDLGTASTVAVVVISIACSALAVRARLVGRAIPLEVAGPRMLAATLFFALLATSAPLWRVAPSVPSPFPPFADLLLWIHTAAVAVPYLLATRYAATRSPEDLRGATAASRRGRTGAAPFRGA
jgi:hypothetical protein